MAESTGGQIANVNSAERPNGSSGLAPNRNYQIVIDVQGDEAILAPAGREARKIFPLVANLPERFHMELTSNWVMPFEGKTIGGAGGDAIDALGGRGAGQAIGAMADTALSATGIGSKIKGQQIQAWESTSPMTFNVDLVFYANENTEREVKERQLALLKLCAPSVSLGDQVLLAPGPRIVEGVLGGRTIDIYIGNYLRLQRVIINNVGSDIVSLFDADGVPIGMTVNLGFSTHNACVTTDDLDQMFYGS